MHALTSGLHQAVDRKPDAQSTSFAPRRRSWRQTGDRVGRVAGALRTLAVGHGDRVAILAQNSDRYFELMYAVAWVGAVLVPMNTGLASAEVGRVLADARARPRTTKLNQKLDPSSGTALPSAAARTPGSAAARASSCREKLMIFGRVSYVFSGSKTRIVMM